MFFTTELALDALGLLVFIGFWFGMWYAGLR